MRRWPIESINGRSVLDAFPKCKFLTQIQHKTDESREVFTGRDHPE